MKRENECRTLNSQEQVMHLLKISSEKVLNLSVCVVLFLSVQMFLLYLHEGI